MEIDWLNLRGRVAFLSMEGMLAMWRVSRYLSLLYWCWIEERVIPLYLGSVSGTFFVKKRKIVRMDFCPLLIGLSPRIEFCDSPFKARRHSRDKDLLDWYYAFSCLGWTYWFLCYRTSDRQSTESFAFSTETNFGLCFQISYIDHGGVIFDAVNLESLGICLFLRIGYCLLWEQLR